MKAMSICLLGFGEVGQALAPALRPHAGRLSAWDLKFAEAASAPSLAAPGLGVLAASDPRGGVADADLVISAVTAAQTVEAARSVARHLKRESYFLDLNSTSPAAKCEAAALVEAAGSRYVEAAIMSPIAPAGIASPMLFGGPLAADFRPVAHRLGFTGAQVFSEKLGAAAAAKMCRSVVVKGLEALMIESLLAARHFGVERAVLDSLAGLKLDDWRNSGRYMISRALIHGRRRAEEMRAAAQTVAEARMTPHMSQSCAQWQEWAGAQPGAAGLDLEPMLDQLRSALPHPVAS
jgi:3-hydroxyisobutyrate dehydrogenase-like beta-hydroxyacid dehydrogenase